MRYLIIHFFLIVLPLAACPSNNHPEIKLYNDLVNGKNYFDNGHIISQTQTLPGNLKKIIFEVDGAMTDIGIYYRTGNFANIDTNDHLTTAWIKVTQLKIEAAEIHDPFIQFAVKEADFTQLTKLSWMLESTFSDYFKADWVPREQWQARFPKKDISAWTQDWNSFALHHTAGQAQSLLATVKNIQDFHLDTKKMERYRLPFPSGYRRQSLRRQIAFISRSRCEGSQCLYCRHHCLGVF